MNRRRFLSFAGIILAIGMAVMPAQGARAEPCPQPQRPPAGQNNVWFCDNDSDTVLVFIHGVLSDSRKAWLNVAHDAYWPEIILQDPAFEQPSIFLAGYYTAFDGGDYGIRQASQEVMNALIDQIDGHKPVMSKRNMIFVTHSTGGIVARHLLVENYPVFQGKKLGLLLIASPSGGSQYASYLQSLTALIKNKIGTELQWNHPFLEELDYRFKRLVGEQQIPGFMGKELIEHDVVTTGGDSAIAKFLDFLLKQNLPRIVEIDSAARYFPEPQIVAGTDHISVVKPTGDGHDTHRFTRGFFLKFKEKPTPDCRLDYATTIRLNVAYSKTSPAMDDADSFFGDEEFFPTLAARRITPGGDYGEIRPYPKSRGRYDLLFAPPFPCPGDRYEEAFRLVWPPQLIARGDRATPTTRLCFKRSYPQRQATFARLDCLEGDQCAPDRGDPGMAEPCQDAAFLGSFNPVATARAQETESGEFGREGSHWSVPSIDTLSILPRAQRPGYAQFVVESGGLERWSAATHYSYGVKVNGLWLWIDDWPPHAERIAFSPAQGIHQALALENLAFNGSDDGYETVEVEFRLYSEGGKEVGRVTTRRPYSAFRNLGAPWNGFMEAKSADEGADFSWQGAYVPSEQQDRYEVMLASWKSDLDRALGYAVRARRNLDGYQAEYDGRPVVGRLRAPRPDSMAYGLTFATALPSGQVKSVFSLAEAKAICQWVLENQPNLKNAVADEPYIYDFVPSNFSERGDRGRYFGACKNQ